MTTGERVAFLLFAIRARVVEVPMRFTHRHGRRLLAAEGPARGNLYLLLDRARGEMDPIPPGARGVVLTLELPEHGLLAGRGRERFHRSRFRAADVTLETQLHLNHSL